MNPDVRIVDEPDCGNAPRREILRDIVKALATRDADAVTEYLRVDAVWSLVGDRDLSGTDQIALWIASMPAPTELRFESLVTHGREASASGTLTLASDEQSHFSHVFQFAGATKTAKVKRVASYLITAPSRS